MLDAQNQTESNDLIAIRIHAPAFRFHYDLSVQTTRDDILCWVEATEQHKHTAEYAPIRAYTRQI